MPEKIDVKLEQSTISGIPTLSCFKDDGNPKPLIIVSHWFSGAKEDMLEYLKPLAELGYYVVAIDNRLHGERSGTDGHLQIFHDGKLNLYEVRKLTKETADDIPILLDHLVTNNQIDSERIGMFGVSFGGFITFRTLVIDRRIKVAAPLISSPYWDDVPNDVSTVNSPDVKEQFIAYAQEYSPSRYLDTFYPRALLIQIGEQDKHVCPELVQQFYRDLASYYAHDKERLQLIIHDVGHEFTQTMWTNVINWFQKYL